MKFAISSLMFYRSMSEPQARLFEMTPSHARELIENLVYRPDGFNVARLCAAKIPVWIVSEAWTPARQEEVRRRATDLGFHLVDHLITGDYDLALWHTTRLEGYPHAYVVSLNNAQHDPLDYATQMRKLPGKAQEYRQSIFAIQNKLADWIHDYGEVIVGSVVPRRNRSYLRLLQRLLPGYRFSPYYGDDWSYGFKVRSPPG